jgi:hypothetical protein
MDRLRRHVWRRPTAQPKSIYQMTDEELLEAAGLPPDISDEEVEALVLAIDWDLILQRANSKDQVRQ